MQAYKLIMNTSFAQLKQPQDLKHQHFEYKIILQKKDVTLTVILPFPKMVCPEFRVNFDHFLNSFMKKHPKRFVETTTNRPEF